MVDFLVFEVDGSVVDSVLVDSLVEDFSVLASELLVLFGLLLLDGLEALSEPGLLIGSGDFVVDDLDEADGLVAVAGLGFVVAAGVVVGATDAVAAGVIEAAAVAAGLALALVEADVLVVVLGAVVVVVPVTVLGAVVVDALTPKVAGTVTP